MYIDHDVSHSGINHTADNTLKHRCPRHFDESLRAVVGERTQAGAKSGGENQGLHEPTALFDVKHLLYVQLAVD